MAIADEPIDLLGARDGADASLRRLVRRLQVEEPEVRGHAERVEALSTAAARAFGLTESRLRSLRLGAFLHDVGKLELPRTLLRKAGPLDQGEWALMRRHPDLGVSLLSPIIRSSDALTTVRSHHERWDGGGYPNGLSGTDIPLAARIVAVADAFHAMTEWRPYRAPLERDTAIGELRANAGRQFDPDCVDIVCATLADAGD